MKICNNCEYSNEDIVLYCDNCGKKLFSKIQLTSSIQMFADFKNNEIAADIKYTKNPLIILGKIIKITKKQKGACIILKSGFLKNFECNFTSEQSSNLKNLNAGQKIFVEGKCQNISKKFMTTIIIFNDCKIKDE